MLIGMLIFLEFWGSNHILNDTIDLQFMKQKTSTESLWQAFDIVKTA